MKGKISYSANSQTLQYPHPEYDPEYAGASHFPDAALPTVSLLLWGQEMEDVDPMRRPLANAPDVPTTILYQRPLVL
jgi:hypothetical protein